MFNPTKSRVCPIFHSKILQTNDNINSCADFMPEIYNLTYCLLQLFVEVALMGNMNYGNFMHIGEMTIAEAQNTPWMVKCILLK